METQKSYVILGAGPMGRTIANTLAARGDKVTVVRRDGRSIGPGITPGQADLADPGETAEACAGADAIFSCAAPPYTAWPQQFPALQDAAIEAAARTDAVLVAIENLYGYGLAGTLSEDMPLNATTRKGAVRARMSEALLAAHHAGKAKVVAGRATDFFGPGVTMSALGDRFWPTLLSGKTVDWVGDPDAPHSFAFLPDLARAYIALADEPKSWGRVWHMPALPALSVRELCGRVLDGPIEVKIRTTPSWVLRAVGLFQPAAGELVEMRYMFDQPFIIDYSAFDAAFPGMASDWSRALGQTVQWWSQEKGLAA